MEEIKTENTPTCEACYESDLHEDDLNEFGICVPCMETYEAVTRVFAGNQCK